MRSDSTKVLIDALGLIMSDASPEHLKLARSILLMVDESVRSNPSLDSPLTNFYQRYINTLISDDIDSESIKDRTDTLLQFKSHPLFTESPGIFDQIMASVSAPTQMSDRKCHIVCKRLNAELIAWHQRIQLNRAMTFNTASFRATDQANKELLLREVENCAQQIMELRRSIVDDFEPLDEVDLTDYASVLRARKKFNMSNAEGNVLQTGLQGLNTLMAGGPRYGEFATFAGLSGHFKSGILKEMTRWIPMHNPPPPVPSGYKPLLLQISLENEVEQNNEESFRTAYVQLNKKQPPPEMTDEEMAKFTSEHYEKLGWSIKLVRKIGDDFGFVDFVELINSYRAKGFWTMVVVLDYAQIMKWSDCEGGNDAAKIQNLIRKLANYARHNGIYLVTGVQLDQQANRVADTQGLRGFVNHFSIAMISDCKSIFKESDFFAFIHLEYNHLGDRYVTIKWRKHRYRNSPPKHTFIAYKLYPGMGLIDDLDTESKVVYDIYAVGEEDEEDESVGF